MLLPMICHGTCWTTFGQVFVMADGIAIVADVIATVCRLDCIVMVADVIATYLWLISQFYCQGGLMLVPLSL